MNILFYLIFLTFSLGQLGRVSFLNQQVNFYLYEALMSLLLLYFFFKLKFNPIVKDFKIFISLFIFHFILLFSYLFYFKEFNVIQNIISFLYLLRIVFYSLFFIYLHFYLNRTKKALEVIRRCLSFAFFLIFVFSILQFLFYPDLRNLIYLGWDPHLNRLFAVFFDTSIAAAVYGLIFIYLYLNKKPIYSIVFLILFVLTFSRSAYLALFIAVFIHLIEKKEYKKILIFLLIFLFIFLISPKNFGQGVNLNRIFSIESRLRDYKTATTIWKKSPIFGFGYNRIKFVKERMNLINNSEVVSHSAFSFSNSYLIILVTTGIVGLLYFIGFLAAVWKRGVKYRPYLLFLILLSLADNILLQPFIIFLFGFIAVLI